MPGLLEVGLENVRGVATAENSLLQRPRGGKTPTREQVLTEISRTSNDAGAMGTMSFDAQGDTTLKLLAAYQWVAAAEGTGRFLADLVVR